MSKNESEDDLSSLSEQKLQKAAASRSQQKHPEHATGRKFFPWLQFVSNLFFVFGSVLYLAMGSEDLVWSKDAQDIPNHVLLADDDLTWVNFRKAERFQEAGGLSQYEETGNRIRRWLQTSLDAYASVGGVSWSSTSSTETPTMVATTLDRETLAPTEISEVAEEEVTESQTDVPQVSTSTSSSTTTGQPETTTVTSPLVSTAAPTTSASTIKEPVVYEDYSWEELLPDVQTAYATLGWNSTLWNTGGSAETDNKSWNELTPEQQAAASFLGFTQVSCLCVSVFFCLVCIK